MKILYHHRIASKDGQYVHIEAITTELQKLGHELYIVAPSVAENKDFGSDGGWVSKIRQIMPSFVSELMELAYCLVAFVKLIKAIIKFKPDVIYERYNLYLPSGIWAKKLFKIPLLLEVNSPLYLERNEYGGIAIPWLAKWSEGYNWCNADKVLPVSQVLAGYLTEEGVLEENIEVIGNGVNLDKFQPQDGSNRKEELTDKLVIGFVGFCREWHKLDDVLRLLAKHPNKNLFFLIVGSGPVIEDLKQLANELGFERSFFTTGLVSREQMPYWLDQIDIALQSSVTPWASPLKMLEYMAKGLAILAPDAPNIRELLTDKENGILFEQDNFDDFTAKLNQLCEQPELAKKVGTNALTDITLRNLTWEANAEHIVKLARELING